MQKELHINEIRDYLNRAPKRFHYNGSGMVNNTYSRLVWLSSIAYGTLDEKINRRAGAISKYYPWKNPSFSAARRNQRNNLRKLGTPCLRHLI